MNADDLTLIEQTGRRCSGCRAGRHWRQFEVLRPEGREPIVTCPACRPRLTALMSTPLVTSPPPAVPEAPPPAVAASPPPAAPAKPARPQHAPARPREDRLKRALRTLPPGAHSTAHIAKAAGLNEAKVLSRLQALEAAGEVQQVGKHWSTERPPSDLEAAFERLEARTGNLRIIRPPQRVG